MNLLNNIFKRKKQLEDLAVKSLEDTDARKKIDSLEKEKEELLSEYYLAEIRYREGHTDFYGVNEEVKSLLDNIISCDENQFVKIDAFALKEMKNACVGLECLDLYECETKIIVKNVLKIVIKPKGSPLIYLDEY